MTNIIKFQYFVILNFWSSCIRGKGSPLIEKEVFWDPKNLGHFFFLWWSAVKNNDLIWLSGVLQQQTSEGKSKYRVI